MNKKKAHPPLDLSVIDKDIVSVIELCNKRGHKTYYSCSGHPETEDYSGYIMFEYSESLFKMLLNIIDYIDDQMSTLYPIPYEHRMNRVFYHHQTSIEIDNDKSGSDTNPDKHLILRFKLPYAKYPNQYGINPNDYPDHKVIRHEDYYELLEAAFRMHIKIDLGVAERDGLAFMLREAIAVTNGSDSDSIYNLAKARNLGESGLEVANLIINRVVEGL